MISAFLVAILCGTTSDPGPTPSVPDCGTLAAFNLLRLEGRAVDLLVLRDQLGAPPARGHSMLDLREAVQAQGLDAEGIRYPTPLSNLDRPIVAYLDRSPHGHFIVVRPVGHTGRLVQVFDGLSAPSVIDADRLSDEPGWTGLALRPRRPPGWPSIAAGAAVLILGATVVWSLGRRLALRLR